MSRDKFGVRYPLITGVSDQYRTNQQLVGETNTIDPASQLLTQEAASKALSATGELEHVAIGIVSGVYKVEQAALVDAGLPTDVQSGILAVISDTRSVTWNEDDRTGTATYLVRQNIYNDNTDNPTVYTRYGKLSVPVKRPLENPELVRPDWEAIIKPEGYQLAGTWSAWTTMGGSLRRILKIGKPSIWEFSDFTAERNVVYELHGRFWIKLPVPDLWPVGTKVAFEQWRLDSIPVEHNTSVIYTREYDPATGIETGTDSSYTLRYSEWLSLENRRVYDSATNDFVWATSDNAWENMIVPSVTFEVMYTTDGKHDWVMEVAPSNEAAMAKLSQDVANLRNTGGRGRAYHNLATNESLRELEKLTTQFSTSRLQPRVTDKWNLYYYDQYINVSNQTIDMFSAEPIHIPDLPAAKIPIGAKIVYTLEGCSDKAIEVAIWGLYNNGNTERVEKFTINPGRTVVVPLVWSQVVMSDGGVSYDWVIQCAGS